MITYLILAACFALNIVQAFLYYRLKEEKRTESPQNVKDLMRDLARGSGVIMVRLDPDHLMLRSPR